MNVYRRTRFHHDIAHLLEGIFFYCCSGTGHVNINFVYVYKLLGTKMTVLLQFYYTFLIVTKLYFYSFIYTYVIGRYIAALFLKANSK